jgi:hypothetical protein
MPFPSNREACRFPGIPVIPLVLTLLVAWFVAAGPLAAQKPKKAVEPVSMFGKDHLRGVELIAEVTVGHIYHMGMGVDVVKIRLDRTIMNRLPSTMAGRSEQLVLAHQEQFIAGTKLLLFLQRYNRSERLTTMHRISHLEKNYKDKVRLIEEYVRIEGLAGVKARLDALVRMVFKNLEDESYWIQCYSVYELEGLIREKSWKFTTGDVAYLAGGKKPPKEVESGRSFNKAPI